MASEELEKVISQKEEKEAILLDTYRKLNDTGKSRLIDYGEDLTKIPEYQGKDK